MTGPIFVILVCLSGIMIGLLFLMLSKKQTDKLKRETLVVISYGFTSLSLLILATFIVYCLGNYGASLPGW